MLIFERLLKLHVDLRSLGFAGNVAYAFLWVIAAFAAAVGTFRLGCIVYICYKTASVHQFRASGYVMYKLNEASVSRVAFTYFRRLVGGVIPLIIVPTWSVSTATQIICFILPAVGSAGMFYLAIFQPPTVLFLGNSDIDSRTLLGWIKRAISPLRTVSLLAVCDNDGDRPMSLWTRLWKWQTAWKTINLNVYRTTDDMWQVAVQLLMDNVPLIVCDARAQSSRLAWEVQQLAISGRLHKTIFVGGEEGAPVLQPVKCALHVREQDCMRLSEFEAVFLLKLIAKSRIGLPSHEYPLSMIFPQRQ